MSLLRPTFSFSTLTPESSQSWSQNTSSNPEEGVRRVTIRQLLAAYENQHGFFCIGQQPLGIFMLLANVYKSQVLLSKGKIVYGFDDGSGRISGYKIETGSRYTKFPPFAYATIFGRLLKEYDGSIIMKVSHIQPVADPHEIYFHTLHVIFDGLRYEKGDPGREHWLASESDYQTEDLVSALDSIDLSSTHLSELEQDIVTHIEDLKEFWGAHEDVKNLDRGVHVGSLIQEVARDHQDKDAMDFLLAVERLLAMRVLRTTIDDKHLDLVE